MTGPSERRLGRGILDAGSAVPFFAVAPILRPWHLRWGASDAEVDGAMPGDELIPRASFCATRAITIDAPPQRIWPWIVQMGYRRAGFYSYAFLDNAGYESPHQVLPEYQHPRLGDRIPMSRTVNDTTAFTITGFVTAEWLLWTKPDSTWAWRLVPVDQHRTRLITRLKAVYRWERPLSAVLSLVLLEIGDFPMMRRMLAGIKARAEGPAAEFGPAADLANGRPDAGEPLKAPDA